jgi:S-adenosylmethionine:tRNA ribosyltransferase-isomerase
MEQAPMRVELLSYDLPPDLVAQEPATERERERLLVRARQQIVHSTIADLAEHVAPGTLIVVNDTRVLRARILGTKEGSGGRAEVFLLRRADGDERDGWLAMARASKPVRPGAVIAQGPLAVRVQERTEEGLYRVRLESRDPALDVGAALAKSARVPLPPYIKREPRPEDDERYQTMFARSPGAVAAPTAGLHLTPALVDRLTAKGCEIAACTLHVGLGTFEPVKVDDLDAHTMHSEPFDVGEALADAIARARARHAPVLAIGTTVARALESTADPARPGHVRVAAGETRLLIQPGYAFKIVDRLLTNFHLPRSTLLALVAAFSGLDVVLDTYRTAVRDRYRFFSYGDAMLLDRNGGAT